MSNTRLVNFSADELLFKQGEETRDLYIIRSGVVRVSTNAEGQNIPIADLGKGSFVGEMSFISGLPRSASVRALEPVTANQVSVEVLDSGPFGLNDWAVNIARVIAERVRKTTKLLGEYRRINSEPLEKSTEEIINEFGLRDESTGKKVFIYLKGFFTATHLNKLKQILRTYASRGFEQAVIDFADVPDVDSEVLSFFKQLDDSEKLYAIRISIKNVQLIRTKLLTIKGIERFIEQSNLPLQRVTRHEYLIRQDEPGDEMYVVKTGRFTITRKVDDEEIVLSYAEAGDVIGEMNLLSEGTRTANVRAEQTSVVYKLSAEEFYKNTYHIPNWFMEIIRVLVFRLKHTNELLDHEVQLRGEDKTEDELKGSVPICIQMDSSDPGTIVLRKDVVLGNLEFLAAMVKLLIKHGYNKITIDLTEIDTIDEAVIKYLLKLHIYLQGKGKVLRLRGEQKEIFKLIKQYDIRVPD